MERSSVAPLGADLLESACAGRLLRAVQVNRLGGCLSVNHAAALAAADQVDRIGYHRREVRVNCAAVVRHVLVIEVGLGRTVPVRAAGNLRAAAADHDTHRAGLNDTGRNRGAWLDHHSITAGDLRDLDSGRRVVGAVNVDRIAVTEAEALEPAVEPLSLAGREPAARSDRVERIVRAGDDRNIDSRKAALGRIHPRVGASRDRSGESEEDEFRTHRHVLPERAAVHSLNPGTATDPAAAGPAGAGTATGARAPVAPEKV